MSAVDATTPIPADEAGIAFVCLYACYLRGGIPRFRQSSVADYLRQVEALRAEGVRVGIAPHSVRACPPEALRELGAYAAEHGLPLHVHADEQPREIEERLRAGGRGARRGPALHRASRDARSPPCAPHPVRASQGRGDP